MGMALIVVGVFLFLWAAAVIATGVAMLVTNGRLDTRERWQVAIPAVVCIAIIAAYVLAPSSHPRGRE